MYLWLWRHLPGRLPAKVTASVVLLLGVVALLFFVVFPAVAPHLPWTHSTVGPAPGAR